MKNKKLLEIKQKMFNIPTIQERNDSLINNEKLIFEKLDDILQELDIQNKLPIRIDSLKN